jgi:hypothetical protein
MTDEDLKKPIGVWRAVAGLGDYKAKHLIWPEGLLAAVIGGGGSVFIVRATTEADRIDAMGDVLPLAGAFLAVVFAALAIVVSLPSTSYLRMLEETPGGGMRRFLDPFLVAVGVQVTIVLLAVGYRLAAEHIPWWVEHAVFYAVGFLFVFGLLDLAALARALVRHGILRAVDATLPEDAAQGAPVPRLEDRRR